MGEKIDVKRYAVWVILFRKFLWRVLHIHSVSSVHSAVSLAAVAFYHTGCLEKNKAF